MSKKWVWRVRCSEGHKCNYDKGFTLDVANHFTTPPCVVHQVDVNVGVVLVLVLPIRLLMSTSMIHEFMVVVGMVRSRALSPRREPVRCLSFLPLLKAAHMTGSPCVHYTLLHSTTTQRKNNSKFPGGTKLGLRNDRIGNIWTLSINWWQGFKGSLFRKCMS